MKFTIEQKTFNKKQVAEIFHVQERTVERWIETGELKGIRTAGIGNKRSPIIFSEAQIEAFGESRRMKNFLVSLTAYGDADAEVENWIRLARLSGLDKT